MNRLKTYWRLGPANVARVAAYRLLLKAGLHPAQRLHAQTPDGPLFRPPEHTAPGLGAAPLPWVVAPLYFGGLRMAKSTAPPRWRENPQQPGQAVDLLPWWRIADFDPARGDIKFIWEASRFEWVVSLALAARQSDGPALARLNGWLTDWWHENPPFLGPNWKCAQETSLRVLRLLLATHLLGQWEKPEPALVDTIAIHLRRVLPTRAYALGQQNNHATSEAAALWAGGLFLAAQGHELGRCAGLGKSMLEASLRSLVLADGSFSQNSTNYHRFMLETVIVAELLRRAAGGPALAETARGKLAAAVGWLHAMTDADSGLPFNLGHNDSAYLLPAAEGTARDMRPTIGLGQALFGTGTTPDVRDAAQPLLTLFDLSAPAADEKMAHHFPDGGYAVLRHGQARALLRLPVFRFRPSHCDALHVDFFLRGQNILRDGGTATYADAALPDLSTTAHHNTVQFDEDEQMPRLSRFLWGEWLRPETEPEVSATTAQARYRDRKGRQHARTVELGASTLVVADRLTGAFANATLRWRLAPGSWRLQGNSVQQDGLTLAVTADVPLSMRLVTGVEALHYGESHGVPVLEARVQGPATITTTLSWSAP